MKTKSMILSAALWSLVLPMVAVAQPAGDPFADPKAAPAPPAASEQELIVTVLNNGNVIVEGQTISLAELEQKLTKTLKQFPNRYVRLCGASDTRFQQLKEVAEVLRKAGGQNYGIDEAAGKKERKSSYMLARESSDMLVRESSDMPARKSSDMLVRYEVFSIDPAKAAAMRREKPADAKFYTDVIAAVEKGGAAQESLMAVRCASGQKATTESVNREIYPTEWSPQPAGSLPGAQGENPPKAVVPVLAEAFENRNTGDELEVEPTMMEGSPIIELRLIPRHTWLAELTPWSKDTSLTEVPIFESQSLTTNVNVTEGQPFLIGTLNPPPGSKVHADRIWLAFATVTFAEK